MEGRTQPWSPLTLRAGPECFGDLFSRLLNGRRRDMSVENTLVLVLENGLRTKIKRDVVEEDAEGIVQINVAGE